MTEPRWGAVVLNGPLAEYAGYSPSDAWLRLREFATVVDELGYDHLWVADHLETQPMHPRAPHFEAFTTLAALSQVTTRVRLGQLVTCASFRSAGLLAKEGACIDVMSGGRFILGLGAGYNQAEYDAFGYSFLPAADRVRAMGETLDAVVRLWTEDEVHFAGEHVQLAGAHCTPKPIQHPPPVWLGTHGRRLGLRIAAQHADAVNFAVGLAEYLELCDTLREHCAQVGRDYDEITKAVSKLAAVVDSEHELAELVGGTPFAGASYEGLTRDHFVGPLEHVVKQIRGFLDAGASDLILTFPDCVRSNSTAERFMREVVPAVGNA